jgi:diguanylate cyclase (GGDEF)-like protein
MARIARANFLEVAKLASFDGLTGLRNRLSFESIVEIELATFARKRHGALSFAFVDLDNFKEFNDAQGHLAGDRALKLLADVLKEHCRQADTVGRIGGDEFAILMPDTSTAECESLCQLLSDKIKSRMADAALPVATSIGHATFDQPPASISEIFLKAENAMHLVQGEDKLPAVSGA